MTPTSSRFGPTSQRIARTAIALCFLIFAAVISLGCEPGRPVDFVNETDQVVQVYQGGEFVFELDPGETRGIAGFRKDWIEEIMVISSGGTVLLDEPLRGSKGRLWRTG